MKTSTTGIVRLACAAFVGWGALVFAGCRHTEADDKLPKKTEKAAAAPTPAADAQQAEVEKLIRHYFTTWSNQDIDAYGKCFAEGATIQLIQQERIRTFNLTPFLANQREAHREAASPLNEVPETIEIRFEAQLARAIVYWKLTSGKRVEYGYDHFTLMKAQGKWRIVNLVFYATKPLD